jgi:tripartite-type tricarboxylate transporter receptor subunit TctC
MLTLFRICAAMSLAVFSVPGLAQSFPSKPIKIIVPFPPGGVNDVLARAVALKMTEQIGQGVLIENRAGAGGMVGAAFVAKSAPDGYTVLSGSTSGFAVAAHLYRNLSFDPLKDFQTITRIAEVANVLIVHPSEPARSVAELIAAARAQPGKLNYGSGGVGTTEHITAELFKLMAGVDVIHIPFKGGGAALPELLAGRLSFIFSPLPAALPHLRSGKVRPLAVTKSTRLQVLPEVPTVAESGLPGFETTIWIGLLTPAGTPPDVVARLNAEAVRAIRSPDVRERIIGLGAEPLADSVEEFAAVIEGESVRFADFVRRTGLKLE